VIPTSNPLFVECWDKNSEHYIFFPFGGGRTDGSRWQGPHELLELLSRFPSRGDTPGSLGSGGTWISNDENG
jgi:hypothetical protein